MRAAFLLLLPCVSLCLAGCSCDSSPSGHDAGPPPSSAPAAPAPPDARARIAHEWLAAQAIATTHPGAPVLYAWLDDAAADAVRGGESIARVERPDPPLPGSLDEALAGGTSEVESRLREPDFSGRRRAWPSPWASRLGWPGAPEGTQLARIELRPESVIVVYDTTVRPTAIRFTTDRGRTAPFDEARQVPTLWAAMLFVHEAPDASGDRVPMREYVLLRPEMIGRVSMGSPEIEGELRAERERLTQIARELDARPLPLPLADAWGGVPDADAPLPRLFASVATQGERPRLSRPALMALVPMLVMTGAPFEWRTSIPSEPRPQFGE